jgi:hypothetical protein
MVAVGGNLSHDEGDCPFSLDRVLDRGFHGVAWLAAYDWVGLLGSCCLFGGGFFMPSLWTVGYGLGLFWEQRGQGS